MAIDTRCRNKVAAELLVSLAVLVRPARLDLWQNIPQGRGLGKLCARRSEFERDWR